MTTARRGGRGFTLIDVLVSIFVIAILIGLLLPSLASVNETARRVVCQSNIRQVGLGLIMYADDNKGMLPSSIFLPSATSPFARGGPQDRPQEMVTVRLSPDETQRTVEPWDGLGFLFARGYISAPKVFYCPSHHGDAPYSRYAKAWSEDGGEVVCNYHFRGEGPLTQAPHGADPSSVPTTRELYKIDPAQSSLLADGLRTRADYNHKVGVNFFRADLTVHWFADPTSSLATILPASKDAATATGVDSAWHLFDVSTLTPQTPQ
ncbi:MAG: DUF1559 domain-containing protein [Phycisphaerales bacterium]|jgi:Tfp pilus assembly protein PilE